MRQRHAASGRAFARVHPSHRRSAENLVDYLTLRSHDIRPLQQDLAELGLSSLGRAEEHVVTSLERVLGQLELLSGTGDRRRTEAAVGFGEGIRELEENTVALLGPAPAGRTTRIMVTLPTEAAADPRLAPDLIARGMDCARINCAHDTPAAWAAMAARVREGSVATSSRCLVLADLPGPKLRTGPIEPGPPVLRLRPRRDERGVAVEPALVVLVPDDGPGRPVGPGEPPDDPGLRRLPVPRQWLAGLGAGDVVSLADTRRSRRHWPVASSNGNGAVAEVWDTTYVETGTVLSAPCGEARVGALPPVERAWRLRSGDAVVLTPDLTPSPASGSPADGGGRRYVIGCTLPAALRAARPGHRVWFDDGKIGGIVRGTGSGTVDVEITAASAAGSRLRAGRGINLPDSELDLPAFGDADEPALRFAVAHADLVGLSFAQRPADVVELQRRIRRLGPARPGIVLKIETAEGFRRLPELLLAGMAWERLGVMVARGDLAVECGFERLAEIQEEVLSLCDAGHVPVVWATQVLDQMARTGQPSRAEVSDAAMAGRAECVMLNKGPHILDAVSGLDDILRRMAEHQRKKAPMLRQLRSWTTAAG